MKSFIALVLAAFSLINASPAFAAKQLVYFGTSTRPNDPQGSKGIYVSSFDDVTGELGAPRLAAEVDNPGFHEINPEGTHL
jgi:6-phosphogluconolactonase (cycloisomerase 2 family)